MVNNVEAECSFDNWYNIFSKESLEAIIIPLTTEILKYLEHDSFILPIEATRNITCNSEWSDGSSVTEDSSNEPENTPPNFPEFSQKIQQAIDEFKAVFIKSNWSTPSDATWVTPTKSLKCTSLEDVYLLLKSSDRISRDLSKLRSCSDNKNPLNFCLVLKRWNEINPCTEFRCFVIENELVGICQRDVSQYYRHIESEKYNIQKDITTLFNERIKDRFKLQNYSFDVIRYKKDKVKIIDFGPMNESVTNETLFTYQELNEIEITPEFRFIAEEVGVQPKKINHFCVPQEINDFFQSRGEMSLIDTLRAEVESQETANESDEEESGQNR
ncbi:cell division cycle protein 123 homolog [Leptopilina heterotoma]|uniref:cell division cycle protein 123 homolog n=1 Tax=Leptopilina heterotoma TaxID=63436 RepID=UPI001CA8F6D1|nr:cell division cycle protein 123 homolog [Leptopilina heterotoma]